MSTMNTLLALSSLLALTLTVIAQVPDCTDQKTKDILQNYKTDKEITPLLKGHTYVDIWRFKRSSDVLDCSTTEYVEDGEGLITRIVNVEHTGNSICLETKWMENKGESTFTCTGQIPTRGNNKFNLNKYVHIFYADEYVLGQFSCDIGEKFPMMVISVRKDKEKDSSALKSISSAEDVMKKMTEIMPDPMIKMARKKCSQ